MKKKYLILTVASIIVMIFVLLYFFVFKKSNSEDNQLGQVTRIVKVYRGNLNLNVSSNGVVQPINKVDIRSKAGGKIVQLNIIEGQYVKKGDLLILVDQTITRNNLNQAQADLETAEAVLAQAKNNNKRVTELFSKGLISQQEVDQSNTELVRAQAQLVKAKASLSNAEDQMNDTKIVAPVSGIVLSKNVELGQLISSATSNVGGGTLLATVADMSTVYIYAKVDEVDIGKVKEGQSVKVIADAYPDDTFEGQVERIAPQGVTQSSVTTFDVIIKVKNENNKLKAGMSTSVDIQVFNRKNVLLVSNEALKDPKSEQGKQLMEEYNLRIPRDSSVNSNNKGGNVANDEERNARRERFRNMSDEEREKFRQEMRARMENMSPEEREKLRAQRMQGGNQWASAERNGEAGGRQRRASQVSKETDVRWKIAMVKEGNEYKPRFIKTGPSNFDETEIISGLKENDELQITTISRAKIASQQITDRIRSNNPLTGGGTTVRIGGGGGGGGRNR